MRLFRHIKSVVFFLAFMHSMFVLNAQQREALNLSKKIADKVIADTRFEWKWIAQKEELGMQVLDFRFLRLPAQTRSLALRHAEVKNDTVIRFGISFAGKIKVWLNQELCWEHQQQQSVNPKEIAYNRFTFDQYFTARLSKGSNEFLIEFEPASSAATVFLRPVTKIGDADLSADFSAGNFTQWLYAGPVSKDLPAFPVKPYYQNQNGIVSWQAAPQRVLPELIVDSSAAYQRDPYADWQYSHGTLLWSILGLQKEAKSAYYLDFVKRYTNFILDHFNYLQWQYDSLYAWRGSYHRIFRKSMLDDAGAPALSFASLYLLEKNEALGKFLQPFTDYIATKQVRLADGTFCRPEPEEFTVWADDLFMSVPYLIRMGKATREQRYIEDAVKQVLQFRKYLLNSRTGLYKHGWFSRTGEQSVGYWGRANGWVVWATAELLDWLPASHPSYIKILEAFKAHMASIAKYQDADGSWHQVLTRSDSYKETSCTSMFALAMARGVRNGWLNKSFKQVALKAWTYVASQIDDNGVVHGICRGTEIGFDEQFYLDRKTIDNDPRGLGAVITAGIEISKLP